ncbi:ead/Ea22-like family protein [Citrobacter freundii]|nr:ead/Ea22-like family protein [Citrobacter freundii]MBA8034184.1 ead/Ea22-like family protein [Citrobacter freundii]
MTALNKQALREAAEKATSGKWERGDGNGNGGELLVYSDDALGSAVCEMTSEYNAIPKYQRINNLNFIAAANPATVLALLDELEAEQRICSTWRKTAEANSEKLEAAEKRIAELEARAFNHAILDVAAERQRQVSAEGWTPAHDDQHRNNDMAFAAACYAFHAAAASWDLEDDGVPYDSHPVPKNWPWEPDWWKPTDPRRDLVKAGALIIAEIERIDRAAGIGVKGE